MKIRERLQLARQNWNKRNVILFFCFLVLLISALIYMFIGRFKVSAHNDYQQITAGGANTVGAINESNVVLQEFPYTDGDLGIAIQFATYARTNSGDVNIIISGKETKTTYAEMKKPAAEFADNTYVDILYSQPVKEADKTLLLQVSATSIGDGLTIWTTGDDALPDYSLVAGETFHSGDLILSRIVSTDKGTFVWIILGFTILATIICFLLIASHSQRPEKVFLILVLCLGFLYMIVMTPLAIPDEATHYQSAYELSNVFCFQWNDLESGDAKHFDYSDLVAHVGVSSAYSRIVREFFMPGSEYQKTVIPHAHSIGYPVILVPQALGITFGRLLNANFLITFYLARLFNLIVYAFCIYLAVKSATRFKLLFGMLGIMPMALHQAASCSYDALINGLSFLFVALIIKAIDGEKPFTRKELLHIFLVALLLCPAKSVYSCLLLLLFLIPIKRYKGKKQLIGFIGIVFAASVVAVLLSQMATKQGLFASPGNEVSATNWEGGTNYSLSFILHEPSRTFSIFKNSFLQNWFGWLQQGIGRIFAGHSMLMDDKLIIMYLILLIISSFSYIDETKSITNLQKAVMFVSALGPIVLTLLIMFITWTSNTHTTIQGIQGRYFIPVFPLLFMCINNKLVLIKKPCEKYIMSLGVLTNLLLLMQATFTTLML